MARLQIRNPIRDRWKDYLRMHKLLVTLQAVGSDLAKEKVGLEARYREAMAASMEVGVNGDGTATASFASRGNDGVVERCSHRLSQLETHRAFMEDLQGRIERFMKDNGLDETAGS